MLTATTAISLLLALVAQDRLWQYQGQNSTDLTGADVAAIGDIDADAIVDALVGIPYFASANKGRAVVLSGGDGKLVRAHLGERGFDGLGCYVGGAGDVDQDGSPDYLAGAIFHDSAGPQSGRVYLYSGATGALLWFADGMTGTYLGSGLRSFGDTDADGIPDFWVSASFGGTYNAGVAYLYSGRDGALLDAIEGEEKYDYFAQIIESVGDLDGDAAAEFVISSVSHDSGRGKAYLYRGADRTQIRTFEGAHAGAAFGFDVAGVGDLDGDLIGEIAIGEFYRYHGNGMVTIYSGSDFCVLRRHHGERRWKLAVVEAAGDLNGDGVDEYYLGAPAGGENEVGIAYVYSGRTGRALFQWTGGAQTESTGAEIVRMGDSDLDGVEDVLFGMPYSDQGNPYSYNEGSVALYAGNDLYLQAEDDSIGPGDTIVLQAAGGVPGSQCALYLVEQNGQPVWQLMGLVPFDALGEALWKASAPLPSSSTPSLDLCFLAYAIGYSGTVIDTGRACVSVR